MKKVKFLKGNGLYAVGAVASLHSVTANMFVKLGIAEYVQEVEEVKKTARKSNKSDKK